MAAAAVLKNRNTATSQQWFDQMVTKFGTGTHVDPLDPSDRYKFEI